jgi:hypothetical protein
MMSIDLAPSTAFENAADPAKAFQPEFIAMWWRKRTDPIEPNRVLRVLRCTFCNKDQNDVRKLIAGPKHVCICNECVEICNDIIADDGRFTKQTGGHVRRDDDEQPDGLLPDAEMADAPIPWPETIQCALCQASIELDEGVLVPGCGTLCTDCVEAVAAARSKLG